MIWYWDDMIWYDMIWYDMIWYVPVAIGGARDSRNRVAIPSSNWNISLELLLAKYCWTWSVVSANTGKRFSKDCLKSFKCFCTEGLSKSPFIRSFNLSISSAQDGPGLGSIPSLVRSRFQEEPAEISTDWYDMILIWYWYDMIWYDMIWYLLMRLRIITVMWDESNIDRRTGRRMRNWYRIQSNIINYNEYKQLNTESNRVPNTIKHNQIEWIANTIEQLPNMNTESDRILRSITEYNRVNRVSNNIYDCITECV